MMYKRRTSTRAPTGLRRYTDAFAPYALTLLRVLVGITFLLHGLPKIQNLAGFTGFVGSLGFPLPSFFAIFIMLLEVVGGLLLIVGLGTRWVSLLFALEMVVTTVLVKASVGFIAPPDAPGTGAELDLLLLASALVLLGYGPGPFSIDQNILKREG
jgi:putative oxidoreductase